VFRVFDARRPIFLGVKRSQVRILSSRLDLRRIASFSRRSRRAARSASEKPGVSRYLGEAAELSVLAWIALLAMPALLGFFLYGFRKRDDFGAALLYLPPLLCLGTAGMVVEWRVPQLFFQVPLLVLAIYAAFGFGVAALIDQLRPAVAQQPPAERSREREIVDHLAAATVAIENEKIRKIAERN